MTILDSCVWIAYLNESDSQHAKAKKLFSKVDQGLAVTEYIIIEVATILAMKAGAEVAESFLEIITNNQDIEIILSDEQFFTRCCKLFPLLNKKKLSFIDISLVDLARDHDIISFDKHLIRALSDTDNKAAK